MITAREAAGISEIEQTTIKDIVNSIISAAIMGKRKVTVVLDFSTTSEVYTEKLCNIFSILHRCGYSTSVIAFSDDRHIFEIFW